MRWTQLVSSDRESLLHELESMPAFLASIFDGLTSDEIVDPGPDESFSPVEQCWHLADVEREAFGARIVRLLREDDPQLPDFDGARIAEERNYRRLALADGLAAFRQARRQNLELLQRVNDSQWRRGGSQEGVGPVMLCDLPSMMAEHDASHRREIDAWVASRRRRSRDV